VRLRRNPSASRMPAASTAAGIAPVQAVVDGRASAASTAAVGARLTGSAFTGAPFLAAFLCLRFFGAGLMPCPNSGTGAVACVVEPLSSWVPPDASRRARSIGIAYSLPAGLPGSTCTPFSAAPALPGAPSRSVTPRASVQLRRIVPEYGTVLGALRRLPAPLPVLGLIAALWLGSAGSVQEVAGTGAAFAYLLALGLVVPIGVTRLLPAGLGVVSPRTAVWLALLTLVALVVAFAVVYPIVNSGSHFSGGSDRDDDISVATWRLLHLDYPYYARTYLDNPISHLPGSYFLAVPFVLLGNGAIQNFFWLGALFWFLGRYLRDWRLALFCCWTVLFLSPGVLRELMTGGDLVSNNVYVLLAAMALLLAARAGRPPWQRCLAAVALGIAVASRANFVFVGPFLLVALAHAGGWRAAVRDMAIAAASFLAVTLPFYLYDPDGFSPLDAEAKLSQYDVVVDHAQEVILAAGVALTLALAWLMRSADETRVLRNTALVQGFFVVVSMVLASIALDRVNLGLSRVGYGLNALFFAAVAAWPSLAAGTVARSRPGHG
jgi:hypothetical protein